MKTRIYISVMFLGLLLVMWFTRGIWDSWFFGAFTLFFSAMGVLISILIFLENRNPSKTITWLVVLTFNPVIGFVFYIIFGQSYRKRRMFMRKAEEDARHYFEHDIKYDPVEAVETLGPLNGQLFRLAQNHGNSSVSLHTNTKVLTDGNETFHHIIEELKKAKHHIHLEYYIVREDDLGNKIKDILKQKAEEGVQVRFLYDAVGCLDLSDRYIEDLKKAGVQMEPFLPVIIPLLSNKVNFRNHRKIIVIDGRVGFMGGLNIGDEYLGKDKYFGYWRDTHLWIEGEAVRTLQLIFLQDWYYMTNKNLLSDQQLLSIQPVYKHDLGGVQVVAGGPDHQWEIIKHLFFSMIASAKKSIWIASPYFIPDEDILSALKVASLSGLDVKLLVPSKPDKRLVFYASRTYFPELMEAGMRIYAYNRGFMHSKIIIVDGELASIGSSNMDMRSFHLNFEVNCFLYKSESVQKLVDDFEEDLMFSDELLYEQFKNRPLRKRLLESICRLASPLL